LHCRPHQASSVFSIAFRSCKYYTPFQASSLRFIFQKYVQVGSVRRLKEELDIQGVVSKIRVSRNGTQIGGNPIAPGALYKILKNPVYVGEIVHKGNCYPGEHDAIVDGELWNKVQEMLAESRVSRKKGDGARSPSLLAGLFYDDRGDRMSPSHSVKRGRRYRYYVSRSLLTKTKAAGGQRIPAGDIELIVSDRLRAFLSAALKCLTPLSLMSKQPLSRKDFWIWRLPSQRTGSNFGRQKPGACFWPYRAYRGASQSGQYPHPSRAPHHRLAR
jgi:hypothetical protein